MLTLYREVARASGVLMLVLVSEDWDDHTGRAEVSFIGLRQIHVGLSLSLSGAGGCHAHNVGVSLLATLNMREGWVADSEDQYVQLAVKAAEGVGRLAALRADLRAHILASPLCDAPSFTVQLEAVYRRLWRETTLRGAVSGGAASGADAVTPAAEDAQQDAAGPASAFTASCQSGPEALPHHTC